jgi:2-polyprenyl-3-methyl-5-hydroxy-6-metoxy-1,4-benzoquinol methylase
MLMQKFHPECTEKTPCPLCCAKEEFLLHKFGDFCVVQCKKCNFVYLNPRLKEEYSIDFYKASDYFNDYDGNYFGYESQKRTLKKTFKNLINKLKKNNLIGPRLLEIGVAYGFFLSEARPYFSYIAGTDYSQEALDKAKNYANELWLGGLDDIPEKIEAFDLIVLIGVLEHVYKPLEFLEKCKNLLKEEGNIIISVPKFNSIWYKILRDKWPSFKIPEHIHYFTKDYLEEFAKEAKLKIIKIFNHPHYFPFNVILSKLGINLKQKTYLNRIDIPFYDVMLTVVLKKIK